MVNETSAMASETSMFEHVKRDLDHGFGLFSIGLEDMQKGSERAQMSVRVRRGCISG